MTGDAPRAAVIHFAPHPDDELIGAPATLLGLRDAGHRIIAVACSLGRSDDHHRRRAELEEACRRARFELVIPEFVPDLRSGADLVHAQTRLSEFATDLVRQSSAGYVMSPSPHDGHPGHEAVGRAVRDALARCPRPLAWAMWGLWSELPLPNLYVPFEEARRQEIEQALQAHAGELDRNDYLSLIASRARTNAVLGVERVFGFGEASDGTRYAELLTEVVYEDGFRRTPPARWPRIGLTTVPAESRPIDDWLYRRSDREHFRTITCARDGPAR